MEKEHVKDYITLSDCYDAMNAELFGGGLPGCVLTFEDKGQHFGYYCKGGFVDRERQSRRDEIALNPRHFLTNSGDLELLQTLAHEMCHQWQEHFGKPSLRTYHNKEWAQKMLSIGLVPSSTGKPGGKQTGQRMADYPADDRIFIKFASQLLEKGSLISYYKHQVVLDKIRHDAEFSDQHPDLGEVVRVNIEVDIQEGSGLDAASKPAPSKVKYCCPDCGMNLWGKPDLSVICGECHVNLRQTKAY